MGERVLWELFVEEVVRGLRNGDRYEELTNRLNEKYGRTHGLVIQKATLVQALQAQTSYRKEGRLLSLIRHRYPTQVETLMESVRKFGRKPKEDTEGAIVRRNIPAWRRKLTPAQEASFRQLAKEPTASARFTCSWMVPDPRTGIPEACGKECRKPYCSAHRREARRWMATELAARVRRVA